MWKLVNSNWTYVPTDEEQIVETPVTQKVVESVAPVIPKKRARKSKKSE